MAKLTRDEILERIDAIGTAFENDLNDGEEAEKLGLLFEGVSASGAGHFEEITYSATFEDGTQLTVRYGLTMLEYEEKNDADNG